MAGVHEFGRRKFPRGDVLLSSARRNWTGIAAEIRNHPAGEIPPPVPRQMEVTLALLGSESGRVERRGNGELQNTAARPGTLWFCPIGVVEESIRITDDLENILHIYIGQDVFDDISASLSRPVSSQNIAYKAGIDDDFIRQVGYRIVAELQEETSVGHFLVDSLAQTMAAHLVAKYATDATEERPGALIEHAKLRRVIDYINDNIESDISLSELSDIACLSRHHFSRAFRTALGVPPHRFISTLRLQRAQELLTHTKLSLADIAYSCRFSSQSTFTRAFQRQVGLSPGEYRRRSGG
ncbi:AraC family transcriptional regulator [Pseudoxanthobacter soli DSM 19599]|uniref:AraC family transcriptional regulator n=1 Tax=Pseudoxanthobacter soli DSM 19599 TaxID=1123029 RepID=A0A1M7ZP25_9HYPH|nr:helix-turn-helix domain-containing protein [Pseudoxanthobacter soli]SHO66638.1 AraC family transcriptional regulator [Pseudoxanthobacter soli DSM 19599]